MYKQKKEPIHFIGIGGIGMSGIAEVLHQLGHPVSGSDAQDSPNVFRLRSLGIPVHLGHEAKNIQGAKVAVASSAIGMTNPEVVEAKRRGIPVITRAEMLAELMRLKFGIGIAGTHGKTTTTSLIAWMLHHAHLDPTVVVGGKLGLWNTNARLGSGRFLVAEADESDGSFLKLSPVVTVVTNIDNDHLDHFGSMEKLRLAFLDYVNKIPYYGRNLLCLDDPELSKLIPLVERPLWTYGFHPEADLHIEALPSSSGTNAGIMTRFRVRWKGQWSQNIEIPLTGRHNILNATAAYGIGLELDLQEAQILAALRAFPGVGRRFELKGEVPQKSTTVIDDYGHHPTEIVATLAAAKQVAQSKKQRLLVIFQPHRFSRTQLCWDQFCEAFSDCDELLICDLYPAGETPIAGIHAANLAAEIKNVSSVRASGSLTETLETLKQRDLSHTLVLTLGAGSITTLGPLLLEACGGTPSQGSKRP